ncbi:arginase family protein [Amniculibacterium aquaticum]|uniref:arginase n=1 Tax=Amniculibacterium aquaticum TaxID=2479858 RepID=UPI000F5B67A7|nr:arginase [Amniculibacterium aquaticum]
MNFEDFVIPPQSINVEPWQLGSLMVSEIEKGVVVLVFVSDNRGAGYHAESQNFFKFRKKLYKLSKGDLSLRIHDLGDLISGTTLQDTHYILQELLLYCHQVGAIPVVIGGGIDFSYSMFSALNAECKNINYTHISNSISLLNDEGVISEKNYLSHILSTPDFGIGQFNFLGLQRHYVDPESIKLLKHVDFEVVPLANMMNTTEKSEPYFRNADLVTLNCDAVETTIGNFSLHPQINGLNKREICAYMKEVGLSSNLKGVGVFNIYYDEDEVLNIQLLTQMLWYLLDGIGIQNSHPKERQKESYIVALGDKKILFRRDVFSDLWYFVDEYTAKEIPCTREDFNLAKKGYLNQRFLK